MAVSAIRVSYFLIVSLVQIFAAPTDVNDYLTWCKARPADVVFILDASSSIWSPDFEKQKQFVNNMIDHFDIGHDSMQVGVLTYNGQVTPHFPLNRFSDKRKLKKRISRIPRSKGGQTHTHDAIRYMRETMFKKFNGARDGIVKLGIVITDGRSTSPDKTKNEANLARRHGIHMFAVGVGRDVDIEELENIGSKPTGHYVFRVNSYSALDNILGRLATKTCRATLPPTTTTTTTTTTTPAPTKPTDPVVDGAAAFSRKAVTDSRYALCTVTRPVNIVFIIDSKVGGTQNVEQIWNFVRNIIDDLDLGADKVRMGLEYECVDIPALGLGEHFDKSKLMNVFDNIGRNTMTVNLFNKMIEKLKNTDANIVGGLANQRFGDKDIELETFSYKANGGTDARKPIVDGSASERFRYAVNRVFRNNGDNNGKSKQRFGASFNNEESEKDPIRKNFHFYEEESKKDPIRKNFHFYEEESKKDPIRKNFYFYEEESKKGPISKNIHVYNEGSESSSTSKKFHVKFGRHHTPRRIAIYITDGTSGDVIKTIGTAQNARDEHGIEIFTVGIGGSINPVELKAMASCEDDDHAVFVNDHAQLGQVKDKMVQKLCDCATEDKGHH